MSSSPGSLPLQSKVSLTLLLVIAAFIGLCYVILRLLVTPAFDDLEMQAARTDLVRAEQAIKTDIENLAAVTADWAPWDDIHDYARGINPGFRRSNLDRPTLTNLGLDFMAVYGVNGVHLWSKALLDGNERPISELGIFEDPGGDNVLTLHSSPDSRSIGIVRTALGPAIVSSMPILRSDDSGPIAGALVMGQMLDDERLQRMRARTEVNFEWRFIDASAEADAVAVPIFTPEDNHVLGCTILRDIHGKPLLVLTTKTPRHISGLGDQAVNAALLSLAVAGILLMIIVWFLLQQTILRPVHALAAHMADIRASGDLSKTLDLKRDDEIGQLARQFDTLTAEVHDARQALLDQSFKAGKADAAAEVLHNIRNAMTPMINGVDRLARSFKIASNVRVREATGQLADPDCPPERRDKLLQYVNASFGRIEEVEAEASRDLKLVKSQAHQIEGILSDQERLANVPPVVEDIRIDTVLDEAANVIPRNCEPAVMLESDAALSSFCVHAHRTGLLQVMGNLMLNAYEAIQRTGTREGHIRLSAREEVVGDKPMIRVTIGDTGCGFDDDVSRRMFQRGFTSKKQCDANGLGLHWCANAIASMGGRIVAESRGNGQGAEIHVLLPAAQGGTG